MRQASKFPGAMLWGPSCALYLHGRVLSEVEGSFAGLSLKCHH